jgi:hypothetical protein
VGLSSEVLGECAASGGYVMCSKDVVNENSDYKMLSNHFPEGFRYGLSCHHTLKI